MPDAASDQVAYGIYRRIFESLTASADGQPPVRDAASTRLIMCLPAQAISEADFAKPWTPGNTAGSKDAAIALAALADAIPAWGDRFADSGREVSDVYGRIVQSARPMASSVDNREKVAFERADKVLYREVEVLDSETGEKTRKRVKTEAYANYTKNQAAYDAARAAYATAWAKGKDDPSWPMLGQSLRGPVRAVYDQLKAEGSEAVEAALAIVARSSNNVIDRMLENARFAFESQQLSLAPGESTWRALAMPSTWYDPDGDAAWTSISYSHEDFAQEDSASATNWSARAGLNVGVWSVDPVGATYAKNREHSDTETSSISVSFDMALVSLDRPWLDFSLLSLSDWELPGAKPGSISKGPEGDNENSAWPLLTTGFVAIKNLKIDAQWGNEDLDRIEKAISGDVKVGYGPFTLSGGFAHSSADRTFKATRDGSAVTVGPVQIVGYVCQIVPYAPPHPSSGEPGDVEIATPEGAPT